MTDPNQSYENYDWSAYYNDPAYAAWYSQYYSSQQPSTSTNTNVGNTNTNTNTIATVTATSSPSNSKKPNMSITAHDAELVAAMATQSSIYTPSGRATEAGRRLVVQANALKSKRTTVLKQGGGHTWEDPTLLEWDPSHFRLFVGDLGGDVTDQILFDSFKKYSPSKARIIRDKRTTKSKGFGFVSFPNANDFMSAWKEMNGKYVGSRPVKLRKATTSVNPVTIGKRKSQALKQDKRSTPTLKRA